MLEHWKLVLGMLAIGGFIGMIVMALICWYLSKNTLDKVELTGEALGMGGSIMLEAKDGRLDYEVILDSLYASNWRRYGLLGWLGNKNIYSVDSLDIASALHRSVCTPFPDDPDTDMRVIVKAWKECATKDVVVELRRMVKDREVPFHRGGDIIRVSVPESPPDSGKAFACKDGIFHGNTVHVSTLEEIPKAVTVDASAGYYLCPANTKISKMHMNLKDIRTLFGENGQIDSVVAVPYEQSYGQQ